MKEYNLKYDIGQTVYVIVLDDEATYNIYVDTIIGYNIDEIGVSVELRDLSPQPENLVFPNMKELCDKLIKLDDETNKD